MGPVGENCQLMDVARRIFPSSFVCFIPGSGGGDGGDGGGGGGGGGGDGGGGGGGGGGERKVREETSL